MLSVLSPFLYEADGSEPKPGLWIALYLTSPILNVMIIEMSCRVQEVSFEINSIKLITCTSNCDIEDQRYKCYNQKHLC